jgi:hypothetical protein
MMTIDPFFLVWIIGSVIFAIAGPIVAAITKVQGKWKTTDDIDGWIFSWVFLVAIWVIIVPIILGAAAVCLPIYGIYRLALHIATEVALNKKIKQSLKTEK